MRSQYPSALELFERFRPEFRQIALVPAGFKIPNETSGLCSGRVYFELRHLGARAGRLEGTMSNRDLYFNLREGKLRFNLKYDPESHSPLAQLEEAVAKSLFAGPFKDVRFFIDPSGEEEGQWRCERFRVTADRDVPGLHLPDSIQMHGPDWKTIIPPGKEREAIEAAEVLEWARHEHLRQPEKTFDEKLEVVGL
ncbi:hypothetical protein A2765_04715 [Candidatus Kaiserbacteria bacterium RIFCSPHIGHO2_01_FULL_56_24]|uniref:Uncharacterized protein n=1 Tax=Candidatus Kaiserbacteria bacterium RIFCSPHIGHO2_01_FULL_56_24 TaxID=1798487 RepID=A0A1F6DEJ8_9BACT|nr:MAG: hypothetical protein A2765_04715 [Candidatus Kaiserbacteria bacterium RIFCSPHIGHO2_01_FULL_56_24]